MGVKPPPNRGAGGKAPQFRLFLCLYSWSPHQKPLVPNRAPPQACWVVGRVYLTYLILSSLPSYLELRPQYKKKKKKSFYITHIINVGFYFSPKKMRTFWLPLPRFFLVYHLKVKLTLSRSLDVTVRPRSRLGTFV